MASLPHKSFDRNYGMSQSLLGNPPVGNTLTWFSTLDEKGIGLPDSPVDGIQFVGFKMGQVALFGAANDIVLEAQVTAEKSQTEAIVHPTMDFTAVAEIADFHLSHGFPP